MNLRRRARTVSEVSTASLNDIMFFLLLFFLITSTLINPNIIKMSLPKATNQAVVRKTVVVNISEGGQMYVNKTPVSIETLSARLAEITNGETENVSVLMNADKTTPWDEIVKVMNIAGKLNLRVYAATAPEK